MVPESFWCEIVHLDEVTLKKHVVILKYSSKTTLTISFKILAIIVLISITNTYFSYKISEKLV